MNYADHNDQFTAMVSASDQAKELKRLRAIENAASRVAGSRRNGIVTDVKVLDRLDAALEARE